MSSREYLATISILIKDRKIHASDVNNLLTEKGDIILARLGLNGKNIDIKNCSGFITIVVKSNLKEIKDLNKKLDGLYGIVAKLNIMNN